MFLGITPEILLGCSRSIELDKLRSGRKLTSSSASMQVVFCCLNAFMPIKSPRLTTTAPLADTTQFLDTLGCSPKCHREEDASSLQDAVRFRSRSQHQRPVHL